MPSRDAWDAAFCCGSNSVTRRAALRSVGDALPTGSITEDMLLTLVLLRQGYVTRYLCEPLAFGLAPESIEAFFVQRQRWARGATQIMLLKDGPFGPNLGFIHRLLFLPTHWLSQSCTTVLTVVTPLIFLLTGLSPLVNVTDDAVLSYIVPMILALIGGLQVFAASDYHPLASQVLNSFQSFKILPTVLATLIRPFGHSFKVTPKGQGARRVGYDRSIFWSAASLIFLTIGGLILNSIPDYRVIDQASLVPVMAIWGIDQRRHVVLGLHDGTASAGAPIGRAVFAGGIGRHFCFGPARFRQALLRIFRSRAQRSDRRRSAIWV